MLRRNLENGQFKKPVFVDRRAPARPCWAHTICLLCLEVGQHLLLAAGTGVSVCGPAMPRVLAGGGVGACAPLASHAHGRTGTSRRASFCASSSTTVARSPRSASAHGTRDPAVRQLPPFRARKQRAARSRHAQAQAAPAPALAPGLKSAAACARVHARARAGARARPPYATRVFSPRVRSRNAPPLPPSTPRAAGVPTKPDANGAHSRGRIAAPVSAAATPRPAMRRPRPSRRREDCCSGLRFFFHSFRPNSFRGRQIAPWGNVS